MASEKGGYFDLQVNGYAGVDLNAVTLSLDEVEPMCQRLLADGTGGILSTIVTDAVPRMVERLARLADFHARSPLVRRVVRGIHIEGPFLNETEGYIGAHPAAEARPANLDDARRLLDAGGGLVRMVTLAPERDPDLAVTRFLVGQGVKVSAGHCDAPLELLREAIDAGLSLFTHLGNACAARVDRHNNIIQRALSLSDRLWICFIADGAHLPWFALGNYLRCATPQRSVVVTDAMAAAGLGLKPGRYTLGARTVDIGPDMIARHGERGYLAGSSITMAASAENLARHLRLDAEQVRLVTSVNPRRAVGLEDDEADAA